MEERKILRRADVERETGLKRSTIYAGMKCGNFPKPIRLGPKAVGWLAHEVRAWVDERIRERGEA